MNSKIYKTLGIVAIIASIIVSFLVAYTELPDVSRFGEASTTTVFAWETFLLYSLLGSIGGTILIGIGSLSESLLSSIVSTVNTLQKENTRNMQKTISDTYTTSTTSTSKPTTHPTTNATNKPIQTSKSKYCQECNRALPANSRIPICDECQNKK